MRRDRRAPLSPHIRVRCAEQHPLIIERPEKQLTAKRRAMVVLTGIGWTVWIYLWRPLLTLMLWLCGGEIAGRQWIELRGWEGMADFVLNVMPYGWGLCAALFVWALVNYVRFRGNERRRARPLASAEDDAAHARVGAGAIATARRVRNLVCRHDDDGHLTAIRWGDAEAADAARENAVIEMSAASTTLR
jgi:biofilm PGA synthesis protein PgaD